MEKLLIKILKEKHLEDSFIDRIINSGYIAKHLADDRIVVSDKMYGNKMFSSVFDIDKFIDYVNGKNTFAELPKFRTYKVKTLQEIQDILNEDSRKRYIENGLMSFRGQTKEYTFKREIPNPVRANEKGEELSIIPGAFRGKPFRTDDQLFTYEKSTVKPYLYNLEPNNKNVYYDSSHAYDIMRVEQHYAKQTSGLDITFDIETALYFATNKLNWNDDKTVYYAGIEQGKHNGVIYIFVFREPSVKKTEFLIQGFDLFKTYQPLRILRQNCGLPLFQDCERNIAICDIDCIIYLDQEFSYKTKLTYKHLFPNESEDLFYGKLMELKRKDDLKLLEHVMEYRY